MGVHGSEWRRGGCKRRSAEGGGEVQRTGVMLLPWRGNLVASRGIADVRLVPVFSLHFLCYGRCFEVS